MVSGMVKYFPVVLLQRYEEAAKRLDIPAEELLTRAFDEGYCLCTNKVIASDEGIPINELCAYLDCHECIAHSFGRRGIIEAVEDGELEIKPYRVGDR